MPKTIGILGGMGPRSTAPFLELVLDQCQQQYGAKDDLDFPHLMIYSLPTPFYLDRPIDHQQMKRQISLGLQRLEQNGVDLIAMPCNTAHVYYEELITGMKVPLLNIVTETLQAIGGVAKRVTLLATKTTLEAAIYQKGLAMTGHEFIFQLDWQEKINELIKMVKAQIKLEQIIQMCQELLDLLAKEKVEVVLIGCTDLSLLKKYLNSKLQLIDSSEALARRTVQLWLALSEAK